MYNTIFWQNEYENDLWYAIPRDKYMDFFGKGDKSVAIASKSIAVLEELVRKPEILNKLIETGEVTTF